MQEVINQGNQHSLRQESTLNLEISLPKLTLIIVVASRIVNPLYAKIRVINESIVTSTRQQLEE